jgi:outer membrane murein-binding lipoprotein Lpp
MAKLPAVVPALAALSLLALGGCAAEGEVEQLRSDIAGLRAAVETGNATRAATALPAAPDVATGPPPAGYVQVSKLVDLPDFVPGLGALYVQPQTLPAGPFLAYDRDNRLVSTIYMIPVADIAARKRFEDLAATGRPVQDVDLYFNPGHPGVAVPHYHFVLWHVPKATAKLQ